MLNLVGVGMSQVPTNSMLGGMGYQDSQNVTVDKLVATGNVGVQTNDILPRILWVLVILLLECILRMDL